MWVQFELKNIFQYSETLHTTEQILMQKDKKLHVFSTLLGYYWAIIFVLKKFIPSEGSEPQTIALHMSDTDLDRNVRRLLTEMHLSKAGCHQTSNVNALTAILAIIRICTSSSSSSQ